MNKIIKQTQIESNSIEKIYNELLEIYMSKGFELEELTKNSFQLQETLESNEITLRHMIINSDECKELEKQNEFFTLSDLKNFISEYSIEHDTTLIQKVIEQYELTEQLNDLEEKNISKISYNLNKIIEDNIVLNKKQEFVSDNEGKLILKEIPKTIDQLKQDHKSALEKVEELFVNEGLIDRDSYMQLKTMVNKLFNIYIVGNKKLPVEEFRRLKELGDLDTSTKKKK